MSDSHAKVPDAAEMLRRIERVRTGNEPETAAVISDAAEAVDRAHAAGDDAAACDLALAMVALCGRRRDHAGREPWARRAVEFAAAADRASPAGRSAAALSRLARVLSWPKWSPEALPLAEQALQLSEQFHGAEGFEVAASLDALASALGDTEGASRRRVELYDRAIRIIETAGQGDGAAVVTYLNGGAIARRGVGDLDGAERLYRRALEIVERVHGPDDWRMPDLLGALGHVLTEKGRAADAVPILERALRLEEVPGEEDSTVIVLALQGLAAALRKAGRASDALPLLDRALRALGPRENSGLGIMVLTVRALALRDVGDLDAARGVARRALEVAEARWGSDSESTSDVREQLGDLMGSNQRA